MTISETLLPEFDQEMANLRKLVDCVPEDKFSWKPHAKSMSLGRLASHASEMPQWATFIISHDKLEMTPGQAPFNAATKAELMAALDKNVAEARALIAGATDEQLAKNWSFVYGGHVVMTMPRAVALRNAVMNHIIHHRGQLSVYLRLQDVPIPGMYGPSADQPMG
ncbi:MAG TPA: DinB family protein [Bryobacteraceae bacterium]|jgi:uncharacterized damage-inducible protein DinB|nr:DinB family protein [Bryobacteraceae bacterium]